MHLSIDCRTSPGSFDVYVKLILDLDLVYLIEEVRNLDLA